MTTSEKSRTIFQRIFDGEIPSYPIFQHPRADVMAFLDVHPATPGHTLIIPREPEPHMHRLSPQRYMQVSRLAQLVALHMERQLPTDRITEHVYGYDVPHAHRMLVISRFRGQLPEALIDPERLTKPIDNTLAT